MAINYFKDTSFCYDEPDFAEEITWNVCTQVPNEEVFIKLTPSEDQFNFPVNSFGEDQRYAYDRYYVPEDEKARYYDLKEDYDEFKYDGPQLGGNEMAASTGS